MKKFILPFLIYLLLVTNAHAKLTTVAIVLSKESKSGVTLVGVYHGMPYDGNFALDEGINKVKNLQHSGSSIFVYIEASEDIPWQALEKVISATKQNPYIEIKSIKYGNMKDHDMTMKIRASNF